VNAGDITLLAGAGFVAGSLNGAAGGGSLVSFPAVLALGHSALSANVTSTVGIWTGYLGGAAGYRRELVDQRARVRALGTACLLGSVAGAVLLLTTPASAFRAVVPYLVLLASGLFAVQPLVARRMADRRADGSEHGPALQGGVFVAAVYGAYFGAGLGVILLAVLGVLLTDDLHRLNGLRSVLAVVINFFALVVYAAFAPVVWSAVGVLAVASLVGGYVGARLARRVPAAYLRLGIVAFGVAIALRLLL
jgi:uncharacterized membrane protein YfcA